MNHRFTSGVLLLAAVLASDSLTAHVIQIPSAYQRIFGGGGSTMYMESMYLPPVTTGPWAPAWSPDGRWIVVAMRGSLWRVPADGGVAEQLTAGPHYDSQPDWSPDGRQIAFTRDTGTVIDIWTIDADGGNPTAASRPARASPLIRSGPGMAGPSFSCRWTPGTTLGFWRVAMADGALQPVLSDDFQNISPSLAPDGAALVFVSNRPWGDKRIQGTGGHMDAGLATGRHRTAAAGGDGLSRAANVVARSPAASRIPRFAAAITSSG